MSSKQVDNLGAAFGSITPQGRQVKYYHISTKPTRCPAIYAPAPTKKPQKTFQQSHLLLATSSTRNTPVLAIEVLIYSTLTLTTLFVSKADSTGFTSSLNIPPGHGSVLRALTSKFIEFLVQNYHRPDRRLVVSLFARAQDQYIFPGSIENKSKHVLSDRQLVKWWCLVLDPILRKYALEPEANAEKLETKVEDEALVVTSKAYLVVPGHDQHETATFYPPSARLDKPGGKRWINKYPADILAPYSLAPPRCQFPHFPDDPKARFLDELDEELPDAGSSQGPVEASPSKRGSGRWKSVRSIDQFWELMAFRQECSSGRLVGFLSVIFTPSPMEETVPPSPPSPTSVQQEKTRKPLSKAKKGSRKRKLKLKPMHFRGPIEPRPPRAKKASDLDGAEDLKDKVSRHYSWPATTRGQLVLSQKLYDRTHDLLLRLDFTGEELAGASMAKWIQETAIIAGTKERDWGVLVEGQAEAIALNGNENNAAERPINTVLKVKRKREGDSNQDKELTPTAKMLDTSLVRKKAKTENSSNTKSQEQTVNVLSSSTMRKKEKDT